MTDVTSQPKLTNLSILKILSALFALPIIYYFFRYQYYLTLLLFTSLVALIISSKYTIPNSKPLNNLEGSSFESYLWLVPLYYLLRIITDTNSLTIPQNYLVMIIFGLIVEITSIYISNGLSIHEYKRIVKRTI